MTKDSLISHGRSAFFCTATKILLAFISWATWLLSLCFTEGETWVKNRFSLFWKRITNKLSSIDVSAVFQFYPCFSSSNKRTCKAVAPSIWRQKKKKKRGRDARMLSCLIYFFAPFSIFQITHNYVTPQAMRQAIPQTHSAFYPHRIQTCCAFKQSSTRSLTYKGMHLLNNAPL